MLSSLAWSLKVFVRRLWVRTALFAVLALAVALMAPFTARLNLDFGFQIETASLERLLEILTDSMLAVTTFSLSIMVSAHLAADASATPRAHRLLREDGRTQSVIATFIGAFIYALTLTVLLSVGLVREGEVALTYLVTIGVILLVVIAILRWVAHLAGLGSVEATLDRVTESARQTLDRSARRPFLGARALTDPSAIPADAAEIRARQYGRIQNIETAALSAIAQERAAPIWLAIAPGDLVGQGDPLAYIGTPNLDAGFEGRILATITIGQKRDYSQDPIFALRVLTEIAERALSPGINDPATAIDAVTRLTELIDGIETEHEMDNPVAPAVYAPALDLGQLMQGSFDPIARDGRGLVEVQMAVQTAYRRLSNHADPGISKAATRLSAQALTYAEDGVLLADDMARLRQAAPADAAARRHAHQHAPGTVD